MKVSLIRHGRPAADLSTRITSRQFAAWLAAYDQAGLDPTLPPPPTLLSSLTHLPLLLTSPTRRALESAHLLANALPAPLTLRPASAVAPEIAPDAVEAPLPTSVFWPLPSRPATLTVVARIRWLFRLAPATENKTAVTRRARRLAEELTARSREVGHVALVGHGYMHIFTRRALADLGWTCRHSHGHGYWSCAQFER